LDDELPDFLMSCGRTVMQKTSTAGHEPAADGGSGV